MSTKQLHTPIPMLTPKGEGFAHFIINDGQESDLYWIVIVTETGEIWTFANKEVRVSKNITLGRTKAPQLRVSVSVPAVEAPGLSSGWANAALLNSKDPVPEKDAAYMTRNEPYTVSYDG